MTTMLADTSALISLEITGLVGLASKFVRFIIPTAVYEELATLPDSRMCMADLQQTFWDCSNVGSLGDTELEYKAAHHRIATAIFWRFKVGL